ncbi:hypothetical protein EDC90_103319 [Martelella mediterranea]|uniref:Uncharacterized protein n=1 Tax=Martelella mediterranea TaxID=293089 RepID=A0A4V2V3M6_9HYPH|nr:hypothetical protein EDC90_103319 [Martelella mediterranea]
MMPSYIGFLSALACMLFFGGAALWAALIYAREIKKGERR